MAPSEDARQQVVIDAHCPPQRIRACVFGASLDVGNRGVLALGVSLARLLSRTSPEIELFFHYGSASGGTKRLPGGQDGVTVMVHNCRMSPRSRPAEHIFVILALALLHRFGIRGPAKRNAWLRTLLDAEFVGEIRGGDSFSDIYGFRRFVVGSLPLLSAMLLRRPYVMLPQTYGPFRRSASLALAKRMLRGAATILTRDRNCESLVFELSGRTPAFCPDVAFVLEPLEPQHLHVTPVGLDLLRDDLIVGVNVSGLLYMGGYTGRNMFKLRSDYRTLVDRLIHELLSTTQARVLLIPHVFGSEQEEEACATVLAAYQTRFPGRIFAVSQPLSERELKWVIGKTHFFVGSRMHACIAGLSQLVPTMGLAYSDKFLGVFKSAGVSESVVDLRAVQTSEAIEKVLAALKCRTDVVCRLEGQIPAVRDAIHETFREVVSGARARVQTQAQAHSRTVARA